MAALVESGFAGRPVDLAFCVGDLSYATVSQATLISRP